MNFTKVFVSFALIGALVLSNVAIAQTPTRESLIQFAKITHFEQEFQKGMTTGFVNTFAQSTLTHPGFKHLSAEKRKQAEQILTQLGNEIIKDVNTQELSQQILNDFVAVAQQNYTQQEIDAMIQFYGTPMGKSIISKQMRVMNQMNEQAIRTLNSNAVFLQKIDQATKKHWPKFEKQLQEVMK